MVEYLNSIYRSHHPKVNEKTDKERDNGITSDRISKNRIVSMKMIHGFILRTNEHHQPPENEERTGKRGRFFSPCPCSEHVLY